MEWKQILRKMVYPYSNPQLDKVTSTDWRIINKVMIPWEKIHSAKEVREKAESKLNKKKSHVYERLKAMDEIGIIDHVGEGYKVNKLAITARESNTFWVIVGTIVSALAVLDSNWLALGAGLIMIFASRALFWVYD